MFLILLGIGGYLHGRKRQLMKEFLQADLVAVILGEREVAGICNIFFSLTKFVLFFFASFIAEQIL